MNHLVELLLGFLVIFLAFQDSGESQPYSWTGHVCSGGFYETAHTSYRTYRTRYQDYYTKVGWWGWERCKRTRSWRSYYYVSRTTSVYRTYYYCCPGWRQSGRNCSIPICSSGCVHGRCTSPNTCSCDEGWEGSRCQYDLYEMDFPESLVPTPTVTHRINDSSSTVEMVCSFDFRVWNNVSYLVEWYANSIKPVKSDSWCIPEDGERTSKDIRCNQRQSLITLYQHFAIGDTVWCKLYMKFSTSSNNNWTVAGVESNQFYVGIEVSPRHVIVDQCDVHRRKSISVTLRPTVPILPIMNFPWMDIVNVYMIIPEKAIVSVDKCEVELKTEDMTHGKTININGICGKPNQTYFFHFKLETSNPGWSSFVYRIPSIKVTTHPKHSEYGDCYTLGRQYLSTFDSLRFVAFRSTGIFVMYTNEAQKVQVQIRFVSMKYKRLSYPCGVAIREGKNVLVLSICDELIFEHKYPTKRPTRKLQFIKRSPGILSDGIHIIKKNRQEREILLSSGLRIVAKRMGLDGLRITIQAPNTDKGKVLGLCGNFNANKYDDFNDRYRIYLGLRPDSISRIPEDKSYFKALPPQEEESEKQEIYCECSLRNQDETKVGCGTKADFFPDLYGITEEILILDDSLDMT